MPIYRNSAEGGTHGTNATAANSGGASGDAWDVLSIAPGSTVTYSNVTAAHGSLSYYYDLAQGQTSFRWTRGDTNKVALSVYVRLTGNPLLDFQFIQVRNPAGSTATGLDLSILTTRRLSFNAGGAFIAQAAAGNAFVVGTWYRIEAVIQQGASTNDGLLDVAIYEGDSTTPMESWTRTNVNFSTGFNEFRIGMSAGTGSPNTPIYVDSVQMHTGADVDGYVGPWVDALPTPANFTFTSGSNQRTLASSWSAVSGAAAYQVQVQVSDGQGGWTAFKDETTTGTTLDWDDTDGVQWATTYQARVRALAALP
jgi:hypothetical protein